MRQLVATILFCAGLFCIAQAQVPKTGAGLGTPSSGSTFVGVGDVVAASHWYGLRAYSAATIGTNLAAIHCVSANTDHNIASVATGKFDTATLTSACPADTYHVTELFDQVGTDHLSQSTDADKPVLVLNVLNGLPIIEFTSTAMTFGGIFDNINSPASLSLVAQATNGSTICGIVSVSSSQGFAAYLPFLNAPNDMGLGIASNLSSGVNTVSDLHYHSLGYMVKNALSSSKLFADGTLFSGDTGTFTEPLLHGWTLNGGAGNPCTFNIGEFGVYNFDASSPTNYFASGTVSNSILTNQTTYWGPF